MLASFCAVSSGRYTFAAVSAESEEEATTPTIFAVDPPTSIVPPSDRLFEVA